MDPADQITTKDLAREEPRAMDDTLAGYAWIPRMIDRSRAFRAGTIGQYAHPCPIDQRCLSLLGPDVQVFGDIAIAARLGTDVLAGLASSGAASADAAWFDPVAFEDALTCGHCSVDDPGR